MKPVAACILAGVALAAAGCGASKETAAGRVGGSSKIAARWIGPSAPPTLAHPLPLSARQTTLAEAPRALGAPVVIPNVALVGPSEVGQVWVAGRRPTERTVAVTFPSPRLIVEYTRPAPSNGSAAHFEAVAQGIDGQVVRLGGGVPALAVKQNSDQTGANFGVIAFNVGGSEVRVMGHYRRATLQHVAQSILERSSS